MADLSSVLRRRISEPWFDAKMGQWVCCLGGVAILPMALVALVRHSGSRSDLYVGLGMAFVCALLLIILGPLVRHVDSFKLPARARWVEFVSYGAAVGVLFGGIRLLATIGGSPAQVTLGLLVVSSLSLAILDFGMMTTLTRALGTREGSAPTTGATESTAGTPVVS